MNNIALENEEYEPTFDVDAAVVSPKKPHLITVIKNKALAAKAAEAKVLAAAKAEAEKVLDPANDTAEKVDDPLANHVNEIENFDKAMAITRVFACEDNIAETYFELGGALSMIQSKKWFDPYPNLDKWVEGQTEMGRSKAHALIQVYNALSNSGLPWSKVSHLGWTKLRRIAKVLTKDNADHWIEVASNNSRAKLVEIVKKDLADHSDEHPEMATPTHKKTFAFYADQNTNVEAALGKAMKEANTDVPSEALSLICIDYLGSLSLAERMKAYKPEAVWTAFNNAFPHFVRQDVVSDDDDNHGEDA